MIDMNTWRKQNINNAITTAGWSGWMSEQYPDDHIYKFWTTRDTLHKYRQMGMRPFTEYDAE